MRNIAFPCKFNKKELKSLVGGKSREEILGDGGILKGLIKSLIEAAMNAELDHHLGYEKHEKRPPDVNNARNGRSAETRYYKRPFSLSLPYQTALKSQTGLLGT